MRRLIFSVFLTLALALPAFAVNDWGYSACQSQGSSVGDTGQICFDFNSGFTGGTVTAFQVNAQTALACFDPDLTTAGTATATARIWFCPTGGATSASCGIQVCAAGGCTFDGANGVPSTQTACVVLGPGGYLLESVAAPAAETGLFSVRGGK